MSIFVENLRILFDSWLCCKSKFGKYLKIQVQAYDYKSH